MRKITSVLARPVIRRRAAAGTAGAAVLALTVGLAGCGTGSDGASGGEGAENHSLELVIAGREVNAFANTLACEIEAKGPPAGLDVQIVSVKNADYGVEGITTAIQQAQAKVPDVIMTDIPDASAMDATLQEVVDNDIKLVTFNSVIDDESIPNAQVTTDVYETGVLAAESMAEMTEAQGTFLVVDYGAGNFTTNERTRGFIETVEAEYPDMEILPVQFDQADPAKAAQIINATLAAHPDLTGIWFTWSGATINSMAAVKDATAPGDLTILSSDADPALLEYFDEGYIQGLLAQNIPEITDELVARTVSALDGEEIDPVTLRLPPVVITPENREDPEVEGALYRSSC